MSSREELIKVCEKMLQIELEMKEKYSDYKESLEDKQILKVIQEIEDDEAKHAETAKEMLSILRK